jgi:hypothetical protein
MARKVDRRQADLFAPPASRTVAESALDGQILSHLMACQDWITTDQIHLATGGHRRDVKAALERLLARRAILHRWATSKSWGPMVSEWFA